MERDALMKRLEFMRVTFVLTLTVLVIGCGNSETNSDTSPADQVQSTEPTASIVVADWITVDEVANTVVIDLVAGQTDANNRWNYNGFARGEATIVVPMGFAVTIHFDNTDPVTFHSAGVLDATDSFPAIYSESTAAVFNGAMTSNATSLTEATPPGGGTESITFTAETSGEYALVCMSPAHAITGMWIGFEVSNSGESGLKM